MDGARDRGDGARQLGIFARLDLLGPAAGGQIPRHPPRPAGLRRLERAARLRLERQRARRRYRTLPRRAGGRELPSDRRQIRRLGLHATRERPAAPFPVALPVRIAGARQRQRQCRRHPRQGRAPVGGRHHAGAPRQRGVRGAGEMVDRRADGQDQSARRLRRVGGAHRHGARGQARPHRRADPDRDHPGERAAVGRGGRALRPAHPRRACDRAAGRQLPHCRGRARAVRAAGAAVHGAGVGAQTARAAE